MTHPRLLPLAALLLALLPGPVPADTPEKLPAGAKVVRIEAHPAAVELKTPFEYVQLLLTAQLENGERIDVTRLAEVKAPALVKVSTSRLVRPAVDGTGQLVCRVGDKSVTVPVKVAGQREPYSVSFVRDVMPVLSKLGCNAGTCHGAQSGKNGFKLSLRGYDPIYDHHALTDDLEGRRFNRAAPDTSLMLLKTSGGVPHAGGVLTQPGEPSYELLRSWIADGVKLDASAVRVKSIEIFPKNPVISLPGLKQQTRVLATYADGKVRDVTAEAFVESSNTEVATVDKTGLVTALRRGETALMARYEGNYAAAPLIIMGDRTGFVWKAVPEYNWIDTLVYEKLKAMKIQPSDVCTDAEFLRRVYIDLTGLPPTGDKVRQFLNDTRPSKVKREAVVDALIGSEAFIEHWTNKWSDLLQVNRKFLGEVGARALRSFIRKAIAEDMPYDKFVYTILTASGSNVENPPASYLKIHRDAASAMENTTQLFLAVRFNCNKCHDHPFERWTQDQYYQLAAFFTQVSRREDPKYRGQKIGGSAVEGAQPLVEIIADARAPEIKHERTGQETKPAFPYLHKDLAPSTANRREQLARWLTSKENQYFATSYVNRIWSYLLGVGLIEPIDDIRAGNPPTNPKLLARLSEEFIKGGFKTRELMRTICKSRTYQHSIVTNRWNADDEVNYSHALPRRLSAETLFDAIHQTTGSKSRLPGLPVGARAAELLDSNVPLPGEFLALFGKPVRESPCECERSTGLMLGPVLNLINGPIVGNALKDPDNRINKLVASEKDDTKVVEELFYTFLCRPPTREEIKLGLEAMKEAAADHARLVANYRQKVAARDEYLKNLDQRQKAWEEGFKQSPSWEVPEIVSLKATSATLTAQKDGSILAGGKHQTPEQYTVVLKTRLKGIRAIRLELLPDPTLPAQGPGRADNGNVVLNLFNVSSRASDQPNTADRKQVLVRPQASFSQEGFPVRNAIDNNPNTGWALFPQVGRRQVAIFEFRQPINDANGTTLTVTLDQRFPQHAIGKFRLSLTADRGAINLLEPPVEVAKVVAIPAEKRTPQQKEFLRNYFRGQDPELRRLNQEVAEAGPVPEPRALGAQDLAWALLNSKEFLFNH